MRLNGRFSFSTNYIAAGLHLSDIDIKGHVQIRIDRLSISLLNSCLNLRRDCLVRVDLCLIEGGPGDPHVEDSQPGESEGKAAISPLLSWVSRLSAHVEGKGKTHDDANCDENGAADEEVPRLDRILVHGHLIARVVGFRVTAWSRS